MHDLPGEMTGLIHDRGTAKGAGKAKERLREGAACVLTPYSGNLREEGHRNRRPGWMEGRLGWDRLKHM